MRAPILAFLLTATILAGCVDDSTEPEPTAPAPRVDPGPGFQVSTVDLNGYPTPQLLCFELSEFDVKADPWQQAAGRRCNFEMTPDEGREGNEVTIAVNPADPRNIVGGAKDYYPADAGDCVWDGVYVTHDGGRSIYQDRSFDGSPWHLYNGDVGGFTPNYASSFWCTTDPVAYFNTAGDLYYLLMAYQTDPVTGSKLGEDELPNGALNDWAFNRATQIVAISSDGGDTFHTFTPVLEGTFPINFHDKGWVAASHDGTVHVMWWAAFLPGNLYFRSTDGGQTYTEPEVLSMTFGPADTACNLVTQEDCPNLESPNPAPGVGTSSAGQGSFVDVGTGGEVYAAWYSGGITLRRSNDYGGTWDPARMVLDTNPQSMPGLSPRDRRTGYPAFATDRNAESPFADALYFVWNDACGDAVWKDRAECELTGANSIYFAASFDRGETFTEPIRISDDRTTNGTLSVDDWSIFPAVSVSPGGVIDVSWMDTRGARTTDTAGEDHLTFQQYYTYSTDGGKTWAENINVRDAGDDGWDPAGCHHQNGMIFIGDYNDIDSSWQAAHPVWPDAREGHCDVYTATIQRPAFAEGWDADARARAVEFILAHPL